jgi:hypothetical protein
MEKSVEPELNGRPDMLDLLVHVLLVVAIGMAASVVPMIVEGGGGDGEEDEGEGEDGEDGGESSGPHDGYVGEKRSVSYERG